MESMERMELGIPPKLDFTNRSNIAEFLEYDQPTEWSIETRWEPGACGGIPPARIIAKSPDFRPDFFMLGYEFFSEEFRELLGDLNRSIKYIEVKDQGSCDNFVHKKYSMAIFWSLSPFGKVFQAYIKDEIEHGVAYSKPKIRDDFVPEVPIFNVATGPWLMCTEEFFDHVVDFEIPGLSFIDYETDAEIIPGRK